MDQVTNEPNYSVKEDDIFVLQYAGFWTRFWAYILDLVVVGSLSRFIFIPLVSSEKLSNTVLTVFTIETVLSAFIYFVYFIFMTKLFSQTIGKMIVGIKVIELENEELRWSTVLFREWIGRFISKTILMIGYLLAAFSPKKQALHDMLSDTVVIHEKKWNIIIKEQKNKEEQPANI
jgi:uncharacterized RDD family membrane protein YckC